MILLLTYLFRLGSVLQSLFVKNEDGHSLLGKGRLHIAIQAESIVDLAHTEALHLTWVILFQEKVWSPGPLAFFVRADQGLVLVRPLHDEYYILFTD